MIFKFLIIGESWRTTANRCERRIPFVSDRGRSPWFAVARNGIFNGHRPLNNIHEDLLKKIFENNFLWASIEALINMGFNQLKLVITNLK
jgi:hypothetical protein